MTFYYVDNMVLLVSFVVTGNVKAATSFYSQNCHLILIYLISNKGWCPHRTNWGLCN